jgi:citrate synthase
MEVCYLLIYGELPSALELKTFEEIVVSEMIIHEKLIQFYKGFNYDAHPMAILCGVVGALSAFYHGDVNIKDPRERESVAIKIIAKMPTIAAYAFRTSIGLPLVSPMKKFSYMENFLYMMFMNP